MTGRPAKPGQTDAAHEAMRAKWAAMTPDERRAKSNIKALTASVATPRVRRLLSETKRGALNPMKRPEVAAKVSATVKARWSGFLSEKMKHQWRDGRMAGTLERSMPDQMPNRAEQRLAVILAEHAPTFTYVGNGAFWIGPCASGKRRNPDFLERKTKRVILMHGEFWHPEASAAIETADYEGRGWRVLVVWSKELQIKKRPQLLAKIAAFVSPQ